VHPKVSVILPFYEGCRWLRQTVESVRCQTEPDWELIIVDDGSSQGPGEALRGLDDARIRLTAIPHAGKGAALNQGVACARAETVCFIDQDDRMLPLRLSTQLGRLECEPEADGVYSDYERRHADGRLIDRVHSRQVTAREALHLMATGRSPVSMQTLVLRKSCIGRLGGFSEDRRLNGLDDLEFFTRLFLAEPVLVHVPEMVQAWVLHDRNYSSGPQFQDAREHCLRRLSELSLRHPALQEELKRFQAHTHTRLGIYFLETGAPARAVPAFSAALQADPFSLNTYYLLLKSIVLRAATS
jgi:glycosyltransferase involved in cell wall biosynthesis